MKTHEEILDKHYPTERTFFRDSILAAMAELEREIDRDNHKAADIEYEELASKLHARLRAIDQEYILCAANWYNNGWNYSHQPKNIDHGFVICGRRHHNCFVTTSILNISYIKTKMDCEQGFLTSKDRWVDRNEAGEIAFKAGQTTDLRTTLFSEDLY